MHAKHALYHLSYTPILYALINVDESGQALNVRHTLLISSRVV